MSKRTVFTELSVCETLIMRQIWAYEGDPCTDFDS